MGSGIILFSTFIAPIIMIITWITCLFRLRSKILPLLTIALLAFILMSTLNPLLVTVRNPYLMLIFSGMLLFNMSVLSYMNESDKSYLIIANAVVVFMMMALHGWTITLRQSDLYFYEHSNFGAIAYATVVSLMSLLLPLIAFIARPSLKYGFRYSIALIISGILIALIIAKLIA